MFRDVRLLHSDGVSGATEGSRCACKMTTIPMGLQWWPTRAAQELVCEGVDMRATEGLKDALQKSTHK
jgi:hypothetical protein